jgi:hypothetical protein
MGYPSSFLSPLVSAIFGGGITRKRKNEDTENTEKHLDSFGGGRIGDMAHVSDIPVMYAAPGAGEE